MTRANGCTRLLALLGICALTATGCMPDRERRTGTANLGGGDTDGEDDFDDEDADDDGGADEPAADDEPNLDDISEFILALGHLGLASFVPKTQTDCNGFECPLDGQEGEEFCNYIHYRETAHAHEFVAFQPNSATLWPGNVVQGEDAQYGLLTPIGLPRAPMTFSFSLENLQGTPTGHMESPTLSSFREQRNEILAAGTSGSVPAQMAYSMEQVYDATQVAYSIGGELDWAGAASFSSLFEFENNISTNKILVDFTQAYYTIDLDIPGLPSDFFTDEVTVDQLDNFMDVENPPMYVQSITYGRRVVFAIETTYSEEEVKLAFDAGFDALFASGGVEFDLQTQEVFEQSSISALVLGGSGADAVKTVFGVEGLMQYLVDGAEYSADSPGAPIAYKLAYLDNSGVEFALTTEYSERQCYDSHLDVTGEVGRLEYLGGNDDQGGVEVKGWLEYRVADGTDPDPCRPDAPGWQRIFDRGGSGAQDVFGIWIPTNPVQKTIYDFEVDQDASLCMRGHLKEEDDCWFCDDDDFGTAGLGPIPLSAGWAGDHTLEFSGDGTVLAVIRMSVD